MSRILSPRWGSDHEFFDGYSLADAQCIARILIPATVDQTDREVSWSYVAADYRWATQITGMVAWSSLTELPGDGSWAPTHSYQPARGQLGRDFESELAGTLLCSVGDVLWASSASAVATKGASPVALSPIALAAGPEEVAPDSAEVRRWHTGRPTAGVAITTVQELITLWRREGCAGRAWTVDGHVGMAGPYATDSLVVSGDPQVVAALVASRLEAFEVDRFDPLPAMTP